MLFREFHDLQCEGITLGGYGGKYLPVFDSAPILTDDKKRHSIELCVSCDDIRIIRRSFSVLFEFIKDLRDQIAGSGPFFFTDQKISVIGIYFLFGGFRF